MEPKENTSKVQDYTLVALSPQETLVEFSNDSSADPNNWTLVSLLSRVHGNEQAKGTNIIKIE